jgi:hypothetical protein
MLRDSEVQEQDERVDRVALHDRVDLLQPGPAARVRCMRGRAVQRAYAPAQLRRSPRAVPVELGNEGLPVVLAPEAREENEARLQRRRGVPVAVRDVAPRIHGEVQPP